MHVGAWLTKISREIYATPRLHYSSVFYDTTGVVLNSHSSSTFFGLFLMLLDKGWRYPVDRLDSDVMWNDMVWPSLVWSGSVHVGI